MIFDFYSPDSFSKKGGLFLSNRRGDLYVCLFGFFHECHDMFFFKTSFLGGRIYVIMS